MKFIESWKIEARIFLFGSQNQVDPTVFIKIDSALFSSGKILHKMYHVLNAYMPHVRKHCLVQGKLRVKQWHLAFVQGSSFSGYSAASAGLQQSQNTDQNRK